MDFTYSDEQQMFADTARQLFADTCTFLQLRKQMEEGVARDDGRWQQIVENGFTLAMLPEELDGLGLGMTDFALIAEQAGYAALPEPLIESAGVAAPLLAAVRPDADVLKDPAATIAIGHPLNPFVADADTAAALLLPDGEAVHLVDPSTVELVREEAIDPFRRLYRVHWTPTSATRIDAPADFWEQALDRAALLAAAQGLGLAQRSVDLAVAYAKERTQFGKPIGSYQAVKHHLASAQVAIEFARPVVQAAAADFHFGDAHVKARISQAKLSALAASDTAARTSIQVHGAMGYSWEVDVHFLLKRTLGLTYTWGTPYFHQQRVAARIRDYATGPDQTFARSNP